ncbi:MAG TPA: tol-pal system protein YbgF [Longimicrobiales bacterium]|nr:tol-pal system protein YbgF [Longimicrobiales bacterium]
MGVRISRAVAVAAITVLTGSGCVATKGDMRALRQDMAAMEERQEEAIRELQRQNRLLLDSIRTTMAMTVDARGSTTNQLRQFDQNVARNNELLGQIMGSLTRLEQRLTALEQRPVSVTTGTSGGGTAEQYYAMGVQKVQEKAFSTARAAFEQLVTEFPQDARAPDAQFQIGETYVAEESLPEAFAAFEQVADRWRESPRAPAALFRAGVIAQDSRDNARARRYYTQVRERYPGTDEARQAQTRLQRLPR